MCEQELLSQIRRAKECTTRVERLFVRVGVYDYDYAVPVEMKKVSSIEYGDGSSNEDKDELVQHLFDLSMNHEIYKVEQMHWATDARGEPCLFGLLVGVRECKGETNITPDVIEAVADILSPYQPTKTTTWAWGYA